MAYKWIHVVNAMGLANRLNQSNFSLKIELLQLSAPNT